ncbi:MAG: DUF4271 domain-containing protein [Muribaculaceae bacterium]|nr:DUF4271 domain-containing protein [Muribaculaceae bacterium]
MTGSHVVVPWAPGAAPPDVVVRDSLLRDSLAGRIPGETRKGLVLVDPAARFRKDESQAEIAATPAFGLSWIYLGLAILFCVTALKFRGNKRYMQTLLKDLTDTRARHNAFDETVRETSLLVLLNITWAACAGVLLWIGVRRSVGAFDSLPIADIFPGACICAIIAGLYLGIMLIGYKVVGWVFSDKENTNLWVKGAAAATGLETILLFPLTLVALTKPEWQGVILIISVCVFIIGKIAFIYQGFRIFFTQITSWLLFLYYLCSLEIIPLIIVWIAARVSCGLWV